MKRILITVLACFCVLGLTSTAKAITLVPGEIINAPGNNAPPAASTVASIIAAPWVTLHATGTFSEWVYRNPTGLLFEYQITNNASSQVDDGVYEFTANDFSNFTTNVDAHPLLPNPTQLYRTGGLGSTVEFDNRASPILPGTTGELFWIQTNAQYYNTTLDGITADTTANVAALGPTIPEPSTMMLLGMGILGLFGLRKRKVA